MKIFLLFFVVCSIEAQNSFELQFLGNSLSLEEATNRELCDTKYCLADAKYLFSAATQNKSVRPCDDFQEFALGTYVKYESVSDRFPIAGFTLDFITDFTQKVRRVFSAPVKVNDSRLLKGMKDYFAKCANSKYINKNGVKDAREYARTFGLKFYPERNDKDFDLKNHIEQGETKSLIVLFFTDLDFFFDDKPSDLVIRPSDEVQLFEQQLEDYASILYDMNQIFRNSSYSEEFKKEFKEIKDKQIKFFHRLKNVSFTDEDKNSTKLMTIEELNNLTSPLNLNWLTIINNQLIKKINSSAQILVERPQSISKIAEYLAKTEKDAIADYLAVDFLTTVQMTFQVYDETMYNVAFRKSKRPFERWMQCLSFISIHLPFTFDAAFWPLNSDKETEDSVRQLVNETIEFALEKFKVENRWGEEVLEDITKRLQSIEAVISFSEEYFRPDVAEELNSILNFDKKFIKILNDISLLDRKQKREQKPIEIPELHNGELFFTYKPNDNILYIDRTFLGYPFYHEQRPRFFNTATVSNLLFKSFASGLSKYLKDKYKIQDFSIFDDHLQLSFEFYESWLKSGGEELNIGANRLTNEQLYWIVVARTNYRKYQSGFEVPKELDYLNHFHKFISSNPGFKRAFDCKVVNQ